jgi:FixJ family two-component response regulator
MQTTEDAVVYVVDDDPGVRASLSSMLRSVGLRVETFGSAREFLTHGRADAPSCLVLDVQLPDRSGLELPVELRAMDAAIPIIFITGHGTIPMSVRAMKAGAVEFLTKPFSEEDLLGAIQVALERDRARRGDRAEVARIREKLDRLTAREREVLERIVAGRMNKQIAAELGTAEQTVKQHRGRVMHKLEAKSVAEVVRLVQRVAGEPWAPRASDDLT